MARALVEPTEFEKALLSASDGLSGARAQALDAFRRSGLPHRRQEPWKWTDLRAALRASPANAAPVEITAPSVFAGARAFEIDLTGRAVSWGDAVPAGVTIAIDHDGAPLDDQAADHPLAQLAAALAPETVTIDIASHTEVVAPVLFHRALGAGVRHRRVRLSLGDGARLVILESFKGGGDAFDNFLMEARLGAGASLSRYIVLDGDEESIDAGLTTASLGADAHYASTALLLGGKASRCETRLRYDAPGARATLASAALLAGARHADFTSLVDHRASDCVTEQIHKSVLDGRARGVFQGKFLVGRDGQKADANMQANALLLSDEATANHKPELEIYADDVLCAHGSTAGALDEEALFYMRQRGLSLSAARALLIEAFINEALDEGVHSDMAETIVGIMKARAGAAMRGAL